MRSKCFAYYESWKAGEKKVGCSVLNREAFLEIHLKPGGCCFINCPFYKEHRDQIRTDIGLYPMKQEIKDRRDKIYLLNYKKKLGDIKDMC